MTPDLQAALDHLREAATCACPPKWRGEAHRCTTCRALDVIARALAAPSWDVLSRQLHAEHIQFLATLDAFVDLRPYVKHLDGCPQAPCTCGLSALLDPG